MSKKIVIFLDARKNPLRKRVGCACRSFVGVRCRLLQLCTTCFLVRGHLMYVATPLFLPIARAPSWNLRVPRAHWILHTEYNFVVLCGKGTTFKMQFFAKRIAVWARLSESVLLLHTLQVSVQNGFKTSSRPRKWIFTSRKAIKSWFFCERVAHANWNFFVIRWMSTPKRTPTIASRRIDGLKFGVYCNNCMVSINSYPLPS